MDLGWKCFRGEQFYLVTASSRFMMARATKVQAARLIASSSDKFSVVESVAILGLAFAFL